MKAIEAAAHTAAPICTFRDMAAGGTLHRPVFTVFIFSLSAELSSQASRIPKHADLKRPNRSSLAAAPPSCARVHARDAGLDDPDCQSVIVKPIRRAHTIQASQ